MQDDKNNYRDALIMLEAELFRFKKVFEKTVRKLDTEDRKKSIRQYEWFLKQEDKALEKANMKIVNCEGKLYDPGMALTPLNLGDFSQDDKLIVEQMVEPIIMENNVVIKIGTAILGRIEG